MKLDNTGIGEQRGQKKDEEQASKDLYMINKCKSKYSNHNLNNDNNYTVDVPFSLYSDLA